MKKLSQAIATIILVLFTLGFPALPVYAQQFSLLPATKLSYSECKDRMITFEGAADQSTMLVAGDERNNTLGCAIITGRMTFSIIPYFLTYITNFLLGLTGIVCVLFIVIGGYRYVIGGLTDDKEKGKGTVKDALIGMGVALLAWTIVNVLINAVTG